MKTGRRFIVYNVQAFFESDFRFTITLGTTGPIMYIIAALQILEEPTG
jgi:hypothetical protein